MKCFKLLGLGLFAAALAANGCGPKPDPTKAEPTKKSDEVDTHAHGNGPHGGVTFDFGKEHGEVTVDHDKKTISVYVLQEVKGKKEKDWTLLPVAAKEFTLTTKETKTKEGKVVAAMTIKLTPTDAKDGKAATFTGSDPGLGNVADFAGVILGEMDGKPAKGEFKE